MPFYDELCAKLGASPALDRAAIDAQLASARTRWPRGPEADARFVAYIADGRESALHRLEDLYLAWWCTLGTPDAITAFEREMESDLRFAAARFRSLQPDDLRQHLRIKLFVGDTGSPPKIPEYDGIGSLRGWLRVTAMRTFIDLTRAKNRHPVEQEIGELELLGVDDPQAGAIRDEVRAAVKVAFATAVAGLAPRERVFLRHVYVDRHTLDQIAALYSVHRTTVARTLATARAAVIAQTRAGVAAAIGAGEDELESIVRALESQVDLSLSRVLARPDAS